MNRLAAVPRGRFLGGCFAAALLVRLAALWVWEARGLDAALGHDPYVHYAQVLLGWLPPSPIVHHPPLYSFWAAFVFAVVRSPWNLAVQLGNVLFASAAVVLFALWAERRLAAPAARLAALGLVFDPLLVYFSPQLQSEPLFVFLLALFFLGLSAAEDPPRPGDAVALGLLGGLLTLTRSVVMVYPAFLVAASLWTRRTVRGAAVWLLLVGAWAVPPALWGLRNLRVHGQFIPIATNGGWTLWEGFSLDRDEVRLRPYQMREEVARLRITEEGDFFRVGNYYTRKTLAFVRENPGSAARIVFGKALLFWRPWVYEPFPPLARVAAGLYFSALFLLALYGAWGVRGDPRWAPVWALFVNLTALHAVMFTALRYRCPLEPFLLCLAAEGSRRALKSLY